MPHRLCYIAEVILSSGTAVIALAIRLLLSSVDTPQKGEMSWLLLPLIGSILASVGAFLFNPSMEDRKTVGGRMMVGVFIGTVAPNIIFYCSETIQKASVIPSVPLLLGFGICTLVYILSKPFFVQGFHRSDNISREIWEEAEKRTGLHSKGDETERLN